MPDPKRIHTADNIIAFKVDPVTGKLQVDDIVTLESVVDEYDSTLTEADYLPLEPGDKNYKPPGETPPT